MDAAQVVADLIRNPARKDRWLGLSNGKLVTSETKIGEVVVPEDCDDYFAMILPPDEGFHTLTVEEQAEWLVNLVHEEAEKLATQHLYN